MNSTTATKRPLTAAEALRNIAREALERRARRESAQNHPDCLDAGLVLHTPHEPQQHRSQVLV